MSIQISGKITLPDDTPTTFPPKSQMKVKFEDVSIADAPSTILGQTLVDLSSYKKGYPIEYTIKCPRPTHGGPLFSVSAVLTVGWTPAPNSQEWVRLGDYLTDTMFDVDIQQNKTEYKRDFHLIHYQ